MCRIYLEYRGILAFLAQGLERVTTARFPRPVPSLKVGQAWVKRVLASAPAIPLPVLSLTGIKVNTLYRHLFEAAIRALVTEVDEEPADEGTSDNESVDAPLEAGDSDTSGDSPAPGPSTSAHVRVAAASLVRDPDSYSGLDSDSADSAVQ